MNLNMKLDVGTFFYLRCTLGKITQYYSYVYIKTVNFMILTNDKMILQLFFNKKKSVEWGVAAYEIGNTIFRTVTEVKQC